MWRLLSFIVVFLSTVASAQDAERPLERAMAAMRDGNWAAARITSRGDGEVAQDVILWHYFRAGQGNADEVQAFLSRNSDWPGLPYLREKSEEALTSASHADVRSFFDGYVPRSGSGALSLARAHLNAGNRDTAHAVVIEAWKTLALSSSERTAFLDSFGDTLKPHHPARLDMALWKGWEQNARAMLPLVSDAQKKLAAARVALRESEPGVDTKIEALTDAQLSNPGLLYERFAWRIRKGRTEGAIEVMLSASTSANALGEPQVWSGRRRTLARDQMRQGNFDLAYKIASANFLTEGSNYADLEWLSGYLSLRFLKRPDQAVAHFERFRDAVVTPISRGRAGYWLGRAHEGAGDPVAAAASYAFGAEFQTSFYGLLAAERGGLPFDPTLRGVENFPPWQDAPFVQSSVFKAAILLLASGELSLAERFLTHLAESLDRRQVGQMGDLLRDLEQPHIQVMLGKRAADYEMQVPGPYYALHPLTQKTWPVPTELVLSIARRESEFDPKVISGVGARGLMQIMPATAKEVSGKLGLQYDAGKLLSDPDYNATLGSAYLAELARRFDGNVVMMAAGYNAGPSRPNRWIGLYGDPRLKERDVIDWIEFIPFRETRNYVMRVAESVPIYRARLGKPPHPVPFSQELIGSTLLPLAPQGE